MHFLYLAATIALARAAALPQGGYNNGAAATNNINKRSFSPTSAEISACLNSALPSFSQEDQDAVRCMCYCGGYGCANVPQSKAVEIKYRLNPKIPDACYSRFLSADAGQTPPIGSGTMYTGAHYETKSADKDEDEDEDEDVTSNDIRIAGLTE